MHSDTPATSTWKHRSTPPSPSGTGGAKLWSIFFLIATGWASETDDLTADEYEKVFAFLYDLSKTAPFDIKTTEAQHYRRFVAQQKKKEGRAEKPSSPIASVIAR